MAYEEVWIRTRDDLKLQGWFIHQEKEPKNAPTIIFFHENAGNIGLRLDYFQLLYNQVMCNILVVAYRGYSASEGKPDEKGICEDARATVEYALSRDDVIDKKKIFMLGRSLGGAVAIHTAMNLEDQEEFQLAGLIIESTFESISAMTDHLFPFLKKLGNLKSHMLKLKWESLQKIGKITTPMMFISGDADTFVPTVQTKRLHEAAVKAKERRLMIVPGGNHNNTF